MVSYCFLIDSENAKDFIFISDKVLFEAYYQVKPYTTEEFEKKAMDKKDVLYKVAWYKDILNKVMNK